MATRTITQLVDDITGKTLKDDDAETVVFSLDGISYEIDTNKKDAKKIRNSFATYIEAGRKVGRVSGARTMRRKATDVDPGAVRAWAASNKIKVSPRGRISAEVIEQYKAAGN